MRLDKFLAESWAGQRKQVRNMIKNEEVTVNGVVIVEAAYEIDEVMDVITCQGAVIKHAKKRYFMFHKPAGCITARKDERHKTVLDYFDPSMQAGLFPVGRLDKDTEGLLLLTNDGQFDYKLMNPKNHVEKTYYFWALGTIREQEKMLLESGVSIGDQDMQTKPAKLSIDQVGYYDEFAMEIDKKVVENVNLRYRNPVVSGYLTITEGKKHQVKRMLRQIGCYVIYLKRISIGSIELDTNLELGQYRELTRDEVDTLMK